MGQQSNEPLSVAKTVQEILNAVFDYTVRALKVTFTGVDTTNSWVLTETKPVALAASGVINAAGSATVLAASAGVVYNLTALFLAPRNPAKTYFKVGSRKITPVVALTSGLAYPMNPMIFSRPFKSAANEAVKVSASAGSAQVLVHYYKTTS